MVYCGSYDGQLYAVSATNGSLRWNYTTDGVVGDTPAVVYLERLTEAWTRTAWAHRPTTPEQVQALYDQWRGLRPAEART